MEISIGKAKHSIKVHRLARPVPVFPSAYFLPIDENAKPCIVVVLLPTPLHRRRPVGI